MKSMRLGALLSVLASNHAAVTLGVSCVMVSGPLLQRELGLNQTQFGLLVSAYYLGQLVAALPAGAAVDRIGIRPVIFWSLLLVAAALWAFSLAPDLLLGFAALALLGVASSFLNPATGKAVLEWTSLQTRGLAMGIKQMGVPVGGLLAAVLVLMLGGSSWRTVTQLGALLVFLDAFTALLLPRLESTVKTAGTLGRTSLRASTSAFLSNRRLNLVGITHGIYNISQSGLWAYTAIYVARLAGGSASLAAICFALLHGAGVIGRIAWGRYSDRHAHRRWIAASILGVIAAASFVGLAVTEDLRVVVVLLVLLGLTIGSHAGVMQALAVECVDPSTVGAALGYNMVFVLMGGVVGPLFIGAVLDATGRFAVAWLVLGTTALLGAAVAAALGRRPRPAGPHRIDVGA